MSTKQLYFSFDVESVGLYGDPFAYGYVVNNGREELECGGAFFPSCFAQGEHDDRIWIEDNVKIDNLERLYTQGRNMALDLRDHFWVRYAHWQRKGALVVCDCPTPVESRFLWLAVHDSLISRKWAAPYPILDVATARRLVGLDPIANADRLPDELPEHHPLHDARQSMRLFLNYVETRPR